MGFFDQNFKKVGAITVDSAKERFLICGISDKKGISLGKLAAGAMTGGASLLFTGIHTSTPTNSAWIAFQNLISYELLEDDSVVTSGGVGQSLIGGAVFGGFGAIAGAISGKRVQKKVVNSMYIRVTINSFDSPCILIPLITKPTKTKSNDYSKAFIEAQQTLSLLDVVSHNQ